MSGDELSEVEREAMERVDSPVPWCLLSAKEWAIEDAHRVAARNYYAGNEDWTVPVGEALVALARVPRHARNALSNDPRWRRSPRTLLDALGVQEERDA